VHSQLITTEELAQMLSVSERTIYRWRAEGKIPPALKIGGVLRWSRDAIVEWLADGAPKDFKPAKSKGQ